jgi:hypothetical protein
MYRETIGWGAPAMTVQFAYEIALQEAFVDVLSRCVPSQWGPLQITTEFNYIRGKTDIIALNPLGQIIAFEVKLLKWKDALHQAYRNFCFAHFSYIVVPMKLATRLEQRAAEFKKYSIGLCYLSDDMDIVCPIPAGFKTPIQPGLTERAIKRTGSSNSGKPIDIERSCTGDMH